MRPLLKESFMFKVSKNAKISFFVKSKNLAVVRVTNEMCFGISTKEKWKSPKPTPIGSNNYQRR